MDTVSEDWHTCAPASEQRSAVVAERIASRRYAIQSVLNQRRLSIIKMFELIWQLDCWPHWALRADSSNNSTRVEAK